MERKIKRIHKAEYKPIGDLETYSPLPSASLFQIDPFLFLNHHGPQIYPPDNNGLPFGPHPHRGMETVTFILEGDIAHRDSGGHENVISNGGVQWMTAGRGLIHEEVSSTSFKKNGGPLEVLQLWVNLPAKHKMTDPSYKGLQKEKIPVLKEGINTELTLVSGKWFGKQGAFNTLNDISLALLNFTEGAELKLRVPEERNIFFYVIRGGVTVNDTEVIAFRLAEFNNDGDEINITSMVDSLVLLGHAKPFHETVIAHGPFVMNTKQEIIDAYEDYKQGRFGEWTQ